MSWEQGLVFQMELLWGVKHQVQCSGAELWCRERDDDLVSLSFSVRRAVPSTAGTTGPLIFNQSEVEDRVITRMAFPIIQLV